MTFNFDNKLGRTASFGCDFIPGFGTAKCIYEGILGKDSITGEKLNGFDRTMCFVGAIPVAGNVAKTFVKSRKATKVISNGAKCAKWADRAYTAKNGVDLINDDDD